MKIILLYILGLVVFTGLLLISFRYECHKAQLIKRGNRMILTEPGNIIIMTEEKEERFQRFEYPEKEIIQSSANDINKELGENKDNYNN